MQSQQISVDLPVEKERAISYISDIHNFPHWATEFCRDMRQQGQHYLVDSPMGLLFLRISADHETGEICFHTSPDAESEDGSPLASRVLSNQQGGCRYVVDFTQPPGVSDEVYLNQCDALRKELDNIKRHFS